MNKDSARITILVLSVFSLFGVHVLQGQHWAEALGAMMWEVAIGLVVGWVVLFNIFLFIFNIFRPGHKIEFNIKDKFISAIWVSIIFRILPLF